MVTADELDRLFLAGLEDSASEIKFARALLDATLFAHGPLEERDPGKLHFVMFRSPEDKEWVIPVFTGRGKVERATSPTVRILEMTGRDLLELTRGAAIMLNPNDWKCTLFPEEIAQLLDYGTLPAIQRFQIEQEGDVDVYRLSVVPPAVRKAVKKALSAIPGVEVAYIVGTRWKSGQPDGLMVAVGGRGPSGEHAARALASAFHLSPEPVDRGVDVTYFVSKTSEPPWVKGLNLRPVYRRSLSRPSSPNHSCN